jgi:hypothetical protein
MASLPYTAAKVGAKTQCEDVPGWHDSDGPTFDCAWYAKDSDRCQQDGPLFENDGYTANEACCGCGGGNKRRSAPTSLSSSCEDSTEEFFVDEDMGSRDCAWLNLNQDSYSYLCRFVDVAVECPVTCNICDRLKQRGIF